MNYEEFTKELRSYDYDSLEDAAADTCSVADQPISEKRPCKGAFLKVGAFQLVLVPFCIYSDGRNGMNQLLIGFSEGCQFFCICFQVNIFRQWRQFLERAGSLLELFLTFFLGRSMISDWLPPPFEYRGIASSTAFLQIPLVLNITTCPHIWVLSKIRLVLEKAIASAEILLLDELSSASFIIEESKLLFKVIAEQSERTSAMITTNLEFSKWQTLFKNTTLIVALVDRLTYHSHILNMICS